MPDSPEVSPSPGTSAPEDPARRGRERRAWYVYDWANSVFYTSVVTVFFGPYLTSLAEAGAGPDGRLTILPGWTIDPTALYPYSTALSVLLLLVALPVVGAIADYTGRKRELMGALAYVGAFATMGLYFVQGTGHLLGAGLFVVASVAVGASVVVYNSFLPDIAAPEERDTVSSRGWATGYLGGAVLLTLHLLLFLNHEALGLEQGHAVRIAMASAGVWWALFALVPLARLRNPAPAPAPTGVPRRTTRPTRAGSGAGPVRTWRVVTASFAQLGHTARGLRRYPRTLLYLVAYIFFNDGVQAVIAFSATFADQALGLGQTVQISAILMVQFVAFGGALLLGVVARVLGTKRTILASLVVWGIVVAAAPLLQAGSAAQFMILAFFIAIVLGGTQALARSLYSHLIPRGQEAEYFGLYQISGRGAAFLGALTIGVALDLTGGDYRLAILSLILFFVIGFVVLLTINVPTAIRQAGNEVPDRI